MATREITGRKVLYMALGAFGVIIAANLALAIAAIGTFPGIEVANGYVASQSFERERAAQQRLGWAAKAGYADGRLSLAVNDRGGHAVRLSELSVKIGRPTTEADDATPLMTQTATGFYADMALAPGLWRVDVAATGANGAPFRQQLTIEVRG